ncbi:MAG: hypothetical protein H0X41_06955, partial [Chitinophagaceae bacterium]|nr:hypothetical protein [Chitinophagaceae bacterium]
MAYGSQRIKEIGRVVLVTQLFCFLWVARLQAQHFRDTLRFNRTSRHHVVLADSALNAIGADSLVNKIENIHFALNRINSITATGFDTRDIEHNFPGVDSSIDIISANLSLYTRVLDIKNLQLFDVMLSDIQQELNQWRASLFKYNKVLAGMDTELTAFHKDEVLKQLLADTAFTNTYGNELKAVQSRWKQAQESVGNGIFKMNHLQAEFSNEYFEALELQTQVRELLRKGGIKSQGKEYPYLWELVPASTAQSREQDALFRQSYTGQRRILTYYFMRNWDDQIWMLVVGVLFVLWILRNYRKMKNTGSTANLPAFKPRYLSRISVLPTLVVLLNLAPFFNLHPPTAYVAIMQMLLIIVLTLLFRKHWPRRLYHYWLVIGGLYVVFSFAGILLTPGMTFRLLLLAINLISILFGIVWLRNFRKYALNFSEMIRFVSLIYVVLNVAAVLCNLFGRLSLAKILSVTGIFSLTQIVGLSVFIEVILEAFQLQTIVNQLKGGLAARMNFEKIRPPLRRILNLLSIFIWIMVFTVS